MVGALFTEGNRAATMGLAAIVSGGFCVGATVDCVAGGACAAFAAVAGEAEAGFACGGSVWASKKSAAAEKKLNCLTWNSPASCWFADDGVNWSPTLASESPRAGTLDCFELEFASTDWPEELLSSRSARLMIAVNDMFPPSRIRELWKVSPAFGRGEAQPVPRSANACVDQFRGNNRQNGGIL